MNQEINDIRALIDDELLRLGFNLKLRGFVYIGDALEEMHRRKMNTTCSAQWLYAAVSLRRGGSLAAIERAIRYSIEDAWTHGDPDILGEVFLRVTDNGKPTNVEFFGLIARKIFAGLTICGM